MRLIILFLINFDDFTCYRNRFDSFSSQLSKRLSIWILSNNLIFFGIESWFFNLSLSLWSYLSILTVKIITYLNRVCQLILFLFRCYHRCNIRFLCSIVFNFININANLRYVALASSVLNIQFSVIFWRPMKRDIIIVRFNRLSSWRIVNVVIIFLQYLLS